MFGVLVAAVFTFRLGFDLSWGATAIVVVLCFGGAALFWGSMVWLSGARNEDR